MRHVALKIIVLGDGGVGKTTLLHRYVNGEFIDSTTMTIGVEFLTKQIKIDSLVCQLILWDISGQARFRYLVERYMKGSSGALLLFDITNMPSFINVEKWVKLVRKYYGNLPLILIAAKCDLEEFLMVRDINANKIKEELGLIDFLRTSSKSGLNVDLAFETLTKYIISSKKIT